ncbi:hypothetical protein PV392_12320 [Streptomyces sp. ME03-5709C]|nr:hypothetical protein [Streptomyces sp. ME03-5709C]
MTTRPEHHGAELFARPARTPEALRAALAQVAPHRLAETEQRKNEAIAFSVDSGSIEPLRAFLTAWAVHVEIARDLDTAGRLRSHDPAWRAAVAEIRAVFDRARAAVGE